MTRCTSGVPGVRRAAGRWLAVGWLATALLAGPAAAQPAWASGAASAPSPAGAIDAVQALAQAYARQVDRRLSLPEAEQAGYEQMLLRALQSAGVTLARDEFVVVVDRAAQAQRAMVWWVARHGRARLVGASPASTGRPSGFEHFETPTGVFEHSLAQLDFRAEGTRNEFGILGYGRRGMRVYDFGWVRARRGWAPGEQPMRLQMHATDPQILEPRLGRRESKGCIRIPATMNSFIDRHGVLDAAYEEAPAGHAPFRVLRDDRTPTPWSGRYLVIVDSGVAGASPASAPAAASAPGEGGCT